MHGFAAVVAAASILAAPAAVSAQGRTLLQTARVPASIAPRTAGPVVAVAPVTIHDADDDDVDLSADAIQRASERILERLRPLEDRLREDQRMRRAGTVLGLGALAVGAVRGTSSLTFVGTEALRLGLHEQLTAIERRSGFSVAPSVGNRSIAVSVSRTFKD